MSILLYIASFIPFYLLGAFPTGSIVARQSGVSITAQGSGNVGATNVARSLGKKAGLITLIIDISKGALSVLIAGLFSRDPSYLAWAGFASVVGHCLSIPGVLRGGKGVATALGSMLMLVPLQSLISVSIFSIVFWKTRIVSLASTISVASLPIVLLLFPHDENFEMPAFAISLLVVYRHRENLQRLLLGTEKKFKTAQQAHRE